MRLVPRVDTDEDLGQVFVANPNKPPQIESILRRNKVKLVGFLRNFHNDREGEPGLSVYRVRAATDRVVVDEQFNDEKQFLLAQIEAL